MGASRGWTGRYRRNSESDAGALQLSAMVNKLRIALTIYVRIGNLCI